MSPAARLCALGGLLQILGILAVLLGLLETRKAVRRYARKMHGVNIDMGDVDEDTFERPRPWMLVPPARADRPKSRVDRELRGLEQALTSVDTRLSNVAISLGFWSDDRAEAVADLVRDVSKGLYVAVSVVLLIAGVVLQTLAFFVQG